jgi:hypothetical protein
MCAASRRSVIVAGAVGAAALALPGTGVAATRRGTRSLLWEGDPDRGTDVFDGLEEEPGEITVTDDPHGTYGRCFSYETWNNDGVKARCESRGLRSPDGSVLRIDDDFLGATHYIGWRALWDPMPTRPDSWLALYQLHVSGVEEPEVNVGPFVLRTLGDGVLYFQHISPDGSDRHIWETELRLGVWNTFVIGFRIGRDDSGWVEFWYEGEQQTFVDGSNRYHGPTLWGTHINHKWGVYRSGSNDGGTAIAYLNSAKLATTYEEAAPE